MQKSLGRDINDARRDADATHRHRVTLKKRYGLLLTQQSEYKIDGGTKDAADNGTEDKTVLGQ